MALPEEAIDTLVTKCGQRRAAAGTPSATRSRASTRSLAAFPKQQRLAETKRRIDAAVEYVHNQARPRPGERDDRVQRLRAALQTRFGEVSDGDLDRLTLKARRAVQQDVRAECRQIVHDVRGPASAKSTSARTRIGV